MYICKNNKIYPLTLLSFVGHCNTMLQKKILSLKYNNNESPILEARYFRKRDFSYQEEFEQTVEDWLFDGLQ